MSYEDLLDSIETAQRDAGEQAVIAHLRSQGLIDSEPNQATAGAKPAHSAIDYEAIKEAGSYPQDMCHGAARAAGWWSKVPAGQTPADPLKFSNCLMLIVSELAEAMEGDRINLMDDHLPHRPMREVELADAVIRIFDCAGAYHMDLGQTIAQKLAYNANRADHKPEARAAAGGKTY